MGKLSRDKGKVGEREVAARLRAAGFSAARRGVQFKGGADSADVTGLPGHHLEVKRTEKLNLWGALEQAKKDAAAGVTGKGKAPVVVHRSSRRDWVAILPLDDFLELVKGAYGIDTEF